MVSKDELDALRERLDAAAARAPQQLVMTSHDLAKRLLALPDRGITIVKGEGGGYISEHDIHPGGPWLDGSTIRVQIQRRVNGVEATPHG